MPSTDELLFEMQRRVVLFNSGTTMPGGATLGYEGDPNLASTSTAGQTLLYNSPQGTHYIQRTNGHLWYKQYTSPNIWINLTTGNGSGILPVTGISVGTGIFNEIYAQNIVYTTGNQFITGNKDFSRSLKVFNTTGINSGEFGAFEWDNNQLFIGTKQSQSGILRDVVLTGKNININPSGSLNFTSRPIVNGTGVLLSGEAAALPSTIVYSTGNQIISGNKTFVNNLEIQGTGIFNNIDLSNISTFQFSGTNIILINSLISGLAATGSRPTVNGTGILLIGEVAALPSTIVHTTGNQLIGGTKIFQDNIYINNLYVTGTEFIANTQNNFIESPYLLLNLTGGAFDGGIFFVTGLSSGTSGIPLTGANDYGPIIGFDHSNKFKIGFARRSDDLSSLDDIATFQNLTTYSGFVDNKYATIINLASTGSTLQTNVNTLTTNLTLTGFNLQNDINSLSGQSVLITGHQNISGNKTFKENIIVQGTGIFEDIDISNISTLYFSGTDFTIINSKIDISGSRPTVNGTGILLIGEIPALPSTIVYITGNQNISGNKTFRNNVEIISPVSGMYGTGDLLNALNVRGFASVGADLSSLTGIFNTSAVGLFGVSPGQFSVGGLLIGQNEGGAYLGRVEVRENSWQVLSGTEGVNWTARMTDSNRQWFSIAMSSDGRIQAAVVNNGQIYTSYDYGVTWTARESNRAWRCIAMSSDGRIQTALGFSSQIYASYDYGVTWTARQSSRSWEGIAMSSDGRIQTAVVNNGQIYTSYDYGVTWIARESSRSWSDIAMSSDGRIQTALGFSSQIYTSYDYGVTWTARQSSRGWSKIAMSSDGRIQTAIEPYGQIYTSYDYGVTWTVRENSRIWFGIAISSDGRIQTAVVQNGQIYTSYDYGVTWTARESNRAWRCIAMSSDGRIQTAIGNSGRIYISYANTITPNPINILGSINAYNGSEPQSLRIFNATGVNSGEFGTFSWAGNDLIIGAQQSQSGILRDVILTGRNINIIPSGTLNISSRPMVNGTGVLLSGEAASLPNTIVYTTGDQVISGNKTFRNNVEIVAPVSGMYGTGDSLNALNVRGFASVNADLSSLTGLITISGSGISGASPGQFSVGGLLIGQNEGGGYLGRTNIRENSWEVVSGSIANIWTSGETDRNWRDIAMSSDGKIQTALASDLLNPTPGKIYISNDYGKIWKEINILDQWNGIAMSSDGKIQTAITYDNTYVSHNYGIDWEIKPSGVGGFDISMSSDGRIQGVVKDWNAYISYDYGNTWNIKNPNPFSAPKSIKLSSDGRIQVINGSDGCYGVCDPGFIHISHDYGNTWKQSINIAVYRDIAISADGRIIAAAYMNGPILMSYDYGTTWINKATNITLTHIYGITMSADGRTIVAAIHNSTIPTNKIYISTDYGNTWQYKSDLYANGNDRTQSIAMSSDGRIITNVYNYGKIWTSYASTLSPNSINVLGSITAHDNVNISGNLNVTGNIFISGNPVLTGIDTSAITTNLIATGYNLDVKINNLSGDSVLKYSNQIISGSKIFSEGVAINDNLLQFSLGSGYRYIATGYIGSDLFFTGVSGVTGISGSFDSNYFFGQTKISQNTTLLDEQRFLQDFHFNFITGFTFNNHLISSDGKYQCCIGSLNTRLVSFDYGDTWRAEKLSSILGIYPESLKINNDGKYQIGIFSPNGAAGNYRCYVSNDYGYNFTQNNNIPSNINILSRAGTAISANGKYQVVASSSYGLYVSNDYGQSFSIKGPGGGLNWIRAAISSDGKYQVASVQNGQLYFSNNYGESWSAKYLSRKWGNVYISSDGSFVVALELDISNNISIVHISKNYGESFESKSYGANSFSMSEDGKYQLFGSAFSEGLFYSKNYGESIESANLNTINPTPQFNTKTLGIINANGKYILYYVNPLVGGTPKLYSIKSTEKIYGNLYTDNIYGKNIVYNTGDQLIDGRKTFSSNIFASGIYADNLVYNTGNQIISGNKTFAIRPNVNNTGVLLSGDFIPLPNTVMYITGNQDISGVKNFIQGIYFEDNFLHYSQPSGYVSGSLSITGLSGNRDGGYFINSTKLTQNTLELVENSFGESVRYLHTGSVNRGFRAKFSSDGKYIIATDVQNGISAIPPDAIYMSYDFGKSWRTSREYGLDLGPVAISADGKYQIVSTSPYGAGGNLTYFLASNNYGNTFRQIAFGSSNNSIRCPHISADGKYQKVGIDNRIYFSNNYGETWSLSNLTFSESLHDIKIAGHGKYQAITTTKFSLNPLFNSGEILLSNNYGETWTSGNQFDNTLLTPRNISISDDGQIISLASTSGVYVSNNYGASYIRTFEGYFDGSNTNPAIVDIDISSDGKYQAFATVTTLPNATGQCFVSSNYGYNWKKIQLNSSFYSVDVSNNGKYLLLGHISGISLSKLDEIIDGNLYAENIYSQNIVYNTGNQTISGIKDFDNQINVSGIKFDVLAGGQIPPSYQDGLLWYDDDAKGLKFYNDITTPLTIGQEEIVRGTNNLGFTLNKGQVVYITGAGGGSKFPGFQLSIASGEAGSAKTLGLISENILDNNKGYAISFGRLEGIDTSNYDVGQTLYLSWETSGAFTGVKPKAPNHMVRVGTVLRKGNAANGVIFVSVQNGFELDELHDVRINNPQNKDGIVYNSQSGLWLNQPIALNDEVVHRTGDESIVGIKHFGTSSIITINAGGEYILTASSGLSLFELIGTSGIIDYELVGRSNVPFITGSENFTVFGNLNAYYHKMIIPNYTPPTSTSQGEKGQIVFDNNFIYVCTSTDNWKRANLNSW